MKPQAWLIAFGLVNVDAMWVVDEAQLMGAGRTTSVQLQQFTRSPQHLPRHSIWMSATLGTPVPESGTPQRWTQQAPSWMRTPEHEDDAVQVLGLGERDRIQLAPVLTGPKKLIWPTATTEGPTLLGKLRGHADGGRLVLVMLNRVSWAQALFQQLGELGGQEADGPELMLLHSRLRPRERAASLARLKMEVPERGRIVVSTQVLEAGVDLDVDVLEVLEVPSDESPGGWPKKKSERKTAQEEAWDSAALLYRWSDLEIARCRLMRLDGQASVAAIEKVERDAPHTVLVEGPVLRRHHLDDLFDTDPDLSGGHLDVSRFVRGDRVDLDVSVLWRQLDGMAPEGSPPPHPDEICKLPIAALRELGSDKSGWLLGLQRDRRRGGAWREVRLRDADIRLGDADIRLGDTVMLDVGAGGYDDRLGWVGSKDSTPSSWVSFVDGNRTRVRADADEAQVIDERSVGWGSSTADPRSNARRWMTLPDHLSTAEAQARKLGDGPVPDLAEEDADDLVAGLIAEQVHAAWPEPTPSRRWRSMTPFLAPLHPRRGRPDLAPGEQLRRMIEEIAGESPRVKASSGPGGLGRITSVRVHLYHRGRWRWTRRGAAWYELKFGTTALIPRPVGADAHFGRGRFVPVEAMDRGQ